MVTKKVPLHSHELLSGYIDAATGGILHKKQVSSIADATLGIMASASLAVAVIGHALAEAKGLKDRHAIKQVGRLLGNKGIDVWVLFEYWILDVVGKAKSIVVAITVIPLHRMQHLGERQQNGLSLLTALSLQQTGKPVD